MPFFMSRNITPDASDLFLAVSQECVSRTKTVLQVFTWKTRLEGVNE